MADRFGTGFKQSMHLKKMLKKGLYSDMAIVASDGVKIKCHKFILTSESDVFEAMFKSTPKSPELVTGTIQMEDMCSKSVESFLAFIYFDDIQNANVDPSVALDLFKAGRKYNVPNMEEQMKKILLRKPDRWFNIEMAIKLYFLVKNLEDGDNLKKKSLDVMKLNYSELYESPAYIQLFEKEPTVARELCADLNFHQPSPRTVSLDEPFFARYPRGW